MKKDERPSPNLKALFRIKEPSDRTGKKPGFKKTHFTIYDVLIAVLIILLIQNYVMKQKAEDVISYSEFKAALRAGKARELACLLLEKEVVEEADLKKILQIQSFGES